MFSTETITFTSALIVLYSLIVFFVGVFSFIALAVLFKHAEKRSVATTVSTLYAILFIIIVVASIGSLLKLA